MALAVINLVPKDLEELRALKEVDLRFFCCFCDKVIPMKIRTNTILDTGTVTCAQGNNQTAFIVTSHVMA